VGVVLGMGAARAGSMDATTSKMLFLHVPARHPSTYPEVEVSQLVQSAALLGVGLLYRGSCHRCFGSFWWAWVHSGFLVGLGAQGVFGGLGR
jgi:hypothetical protein